MSSRLSQVGAFVVFATAASFAICMFGSSLKSTIQVFFLPIANGFGVDRGTLALATTAFAVVTAVSSSLVGYLVDRVGVVPVILMGSAAAGGVLLLCATTPTVWVFIAVYGVLGGMAYTALSFVPLGVLADQLFGGRNAGVVYAVLTNGGAVGLAVLVPLWTALGGFGWRHVLLGAGLVFLLVLVPLSLVLHRFAVRRVARPAPAATRPRLRDGIRAALGDRRARPLVLAFFACGTTMAIIDVHLFPYMADHDVPTDVGSAAVSVLGVLEIAGSLVAGRLCDRGRVRATLMFAYLLRAGSLLLLPAFSSNVAVILFGAAFGASYLATVVATTVWLNRIVPPNARGTALGVLWAVHMLGVAISSEGGAALADATHSYFITFLVSFVLLCAAATLVGTQSQPDVRQETTETDQVNADL